jgi:hypothetical protein
VALMRYLNLCLVALGFVAEHTEQLRGGKSGHHDGAGVSSAGGSVPRLAASATGDKRPDECVEGHRLPPKAQPGGERVQAKETRHGQDSKKTPATPKKKTKTIHSPFKVAL